jgi:hypothetical protein
MRHCNILNYIIRTINKHVKNTLKYFKFQNSNEMIIVKKEIYVVSCKSCNAANESVIYVIRASTMDTSIFRYLNEFHVYTSFIYNFFNSTPSVSK